LIEKRKSLKKFKKQKLKMAVLDIIFTCFMDLVYFAKANMPVSIKIKLLLTYMRLWGKSLFFGKFLKKERIMGFLVSSTDYISIFSGYREIFFRNLYLFKSKKQAPLILDCGANIGLATIFFKWIYPNCEIHSFEPDEKIFKILKKNIRQNALNNVYLYNYAITDENKKISFYTNNNSMMSSVKSNHSFNLGNKVTVNSISLSLFIRKYINREIDLLKLDIEGAEDLVIKDLQHNNLLKNINEWIIEYHHKFGKDSSKLGDFLCLFEKENFEYQIDTINIPIVSKNKPQNVLIYVY